jgi:hypothetical protein
VSFNSVQTKISLEWVGSLDADYVKEIDFEQVDSLVLTNIMGPMQVDALLQGNGGMHLDTAGD